MKNLLGENLRVFGLKKNEHIDCPFVYENNIEHRCLYLRNCWQLSKIDKTLPTPPPSSRVLNLFADPSSKEKVK